MEEEMLEKSIILNKLNKLKSLLDTEKNKYKRVYIYLAIKKLKKELKELRW